MNKQTPTDRKKRCAWISDALMQRYHDEEWGVPVRDDRKHFEFLVLESAQAGLSWAIVLRNRMKIEAAINNARRFLEVQKEFGNFSDYLLRFSNGKIIVNRWKTLKELPPKTAVSDALSKDLKKRGFKFLGSTVLYSHMQAVGMVNDHVTSCFRHRELKTQPKK